MGTKEVDIFFAAQVQIYACADISLPTQYTKQMLYLIKFIIRVKRLARSPAPHIENFANTPKFLPGPFLLK